MSERIDHVAEARRLAAIAEQSYGQIELRNGDMSVAQQVEAQTPAVTAQVHATLALVDQQRTANLLAFSALAVMQDRDGSPLNDEGRAFLLRAAVQIREGLGL